MDAELSVQDDVCVKPNDLSDCVYVGGGGGSVSFNNSVGFIYIYIYMS